MHLGPSEGAGIYKDPSIHQGRMSRNMNQNYKQGYEMLSPYYKLRRTVLVFSFLPFFVFLLPSTSAYQPSPRGFQKVGPHRTKARSVGRSREEAPCFPAKEKLVAGRSCCHPREVASSPTLEVCSRGVSGAQDPG